VSATTAAWLWLVAGGVFEVVWAVGLKRTEGFSRLVPSVIVIAAIGASLFSLAQGLRVLPTGTGYAVWVGIGAVGAVLWGILLEGEPAGAARLLCLVMIVAGIVGLKLASHETA
jgi:quaternary ammonium compound-resistance protein SugE